MAKPQIFIIFCEDVREEIGNKISLMGLLGPKIILPPSAKVIKGLSVVALCRFFGSEPVDAQLSIRFIAADESAPMVSPPAPKTLQLTAPNGENVWTNHIIGSFQGLPIHDGMVVEASFDCLGEQISATLNVELREI